MLGMSEIKTNKVLLKYKSQITDSYEQLAEIGNVPYTSVVKCFRDPARVGAGTMIRVCRALQMPDNEARELWLGLCADRANKLRVEKWEKAIKK